MPLQTEPHIPNDTNLKPNRQTMTNLLAITWNVDPTFFTLFGLDIRYYGVLWAVAFMLGIYYFTKFSI